MSAEKLLRQIETEETTTPGFMKKTAAAAAALALSLSLSACSHEKSETETSPVETTEAAPVEPNMFNPETMEINVDNLKMETEQDPTLMAKVYMNRHQAWNMAGAGTENERKEHYKEYMDYPEIRGENGGLESNWYLGIDIAKENKGDFAEALSGPDWEDNDDTKKWVKERYTQNAVNMGAFVGIYFPEHESDLEGYSYHQKEEITGTPELLDETKDDDGNTIREIKIPVHTAAGNGSSSDPAYPDYDYKIDTTTTFKDLEDGTTVVVGETYSDRYDVVIEPHYIDLDKVQK